MALTDPARELAETLMLLSNQPDQMVVDKIKNSADVEPWSPAFFRVIFEILERIEIVKREVKNLPLDEDIMEDAIRSLDRIGAVFGNAELLDQSNNQIRHIVTGANATVLKMLSSQIRENVSYHKITDQEREKILADVNDLYGWLADLQSEENSFIRQALLEGLEGFIFRLERLEWLGSGYVLNGLKDVILAYMALEGANIPNDGGDELQKAIQQKCKAVLGRTLSLLDIAKDNTDRADWTLRAYGAVSAFADGTSGVTALLN